MAYDPTTVRYSNLAREWQQRAQSCQAGKDRDLFLSIAEGYEHLASILEPHGAEERPPEETVE